MILPSQDSQCCSTVSYHEVLPWRCWRPTCRLLAFAARIPDGGAAKLAQVVRLVTALCLWWEKEVR